MKRLAVGGLLPLLVAISIFALISYNTPQTTARPTIEADLRINPNIIATYELGRIGKYFTFYIELPSPYNIEDIDVSSIVLNNRAEYDPSLPVSIGDCDKNGVLDLAVNFRKGSVLLNTEFGGYQFFVYGQRYFKATLTLSGSLAEGTFFSGKCAMWVIWPKIRPL